MLKVVILSLLGPGHPGPGQPAPDHPGPDHPGPDHIGPERRGPERQTLQRRAAERWDGADGAAWVPVLACAEALRGGGAQVEPVTATSDSDIDAALALASTGNAGRGGGTTDVNHRTNTEKSEGAGGTGNTRLIVAAASDAEVRAVIRRMVRRAAPAPARRPADLPDGRTVADLAPIAVLPRLPAVPELVRRLGLPTEPAAVATAALAGRTRRFDLLRNDGGSVTLRGVLFAGVTAPGTIGPWRGRVEVDDAVLSDGDEPVIACAVHNAGSSEVDGLPLVINADPRDGLVDVAVAVPIVRRRLMRQPSVRFEVRRARGRAISVTPREAGLPFTDDGVAGALTHRRAWWVEPRLWAAYVS